MVLTVLMEQLDRKDYKEFKELMVQLGLKDLKV
jgi:hypothetical protein